MSWSRVCVDLAHHSRFFAWEKFLRVVVVVVYLVVVVVYLAVVYVVVVYVVVMYVVVYLVAVVLRVFLKVYLLPHNVLL